MCHHPNSSSDGGGSPESLLQQVINERNLLRSQNDQLWKLIEKQKIMIKNLQTDAQKLTNDRDKLVAKLKDTNILNFSQLKSDDAILLTPINNIDDNENINSIDININGNSSREIMPNQINSQSLQSHSVNSLRSNSSDTSFNALIGMLNDEPNSSISSSSTIVNNDHFEIQKLDDSLNDDIPSISSGNRPSSPVPLIPLKSPQRQNIFINNSSSSGLQADQNKLTTPPRSPRQPISKNFQQNNSSNSSINSDGINHINNDGQNSNHQSVDQMRQIPVKSNSLPVQNLINNNENKADVDPLPLIYSDPNNFIGNDNDRALRTSKSFSHTSQPQKNKTMPSPLQGGGQHNESNNSGLLNNNSNNSLFIPLGKQGNRNSMIMAPPSNKNNTESSPSAELIGSNKKINDKGKEVLAFVIIVGKSKVVDGKIVDMEKELWRIEKLYSDFLGLDSKLKQKQHKSVTQKIGKLPDKTLFSNNAPSKVDQRKLALEQYLLHVISLNLSDSKDLYDFLSSNVLEPNDKDNQLPGRKEGYLTKKGKSFGGWKSRYFVLNSPLLEYYESKEGSQLGFIRLTNAQIGRQSNANSESDKDGENSYRHAFLILEPKLLSSRNTHTRHVLCAESDSERDAWIEALLQYVGVNEEEATEKSKKKKSNITITSSDVVSSYDASSGHHHQKKPSLSSSQFNNDQIDPSKNIHPSNQQHYPPHRQQSHPSSQQSHFTPHHQQSHPPPHHQQSHPPPHHQQSQPPLQYQQSQHFQTQTSPSLLGVSGSNKMNSRHSFTPPRDELEKNSAPEPRDISPLGNNNNNNQTTYLNGQPNLRKGQNDEHKKAARKTFFGTMFGIKEDKKKNQDQKPDVHKVVFGVPLDQAIAVSRIKEGYELPAVLYRCIEYLDAKDAAEEEGIYRLSGANATIKMLKDRFNTEGDVNLLGEEEYYDVHAVAGLLKLYLRELPTSVLTRDLHLEFVHVIERINELGRLVSTLPLSNYTLLRTLTGHLIRIVQNAAVNKMTARNIGIVFSPTLGIPASVFSLFMAEFDYIFFTDSDGIAAPRTMDVPSEAPDNSKNSPDTKNPPISLSPVTAIRRRDIRDEITGRNNRNSVHYMDSAPEKVVGLERKMTVTKPTQKDDTSDEEVVNDLAIQAEQDDDASSIDELTTQSAPISPRLPVARYPKTNSIPTSTSLNNDSTESNGLLDTGDLRKMRRLTGKNCDNSQTCLLVITKQLRYDEGENPLPQKSIFIISVKVGSFMPVVCFHPIRLCLLFSEIMKQEEA
ncbi:11976_t:CDS:10 [Entrophospora sp. SA101]|nr:11976_t:CDS:10 [Entrophospora sp. SA101]